jgi:hypothetical protein
VSLRPHAHEMIDALACRVPLPNLTDDRSNARRVLARLERCVPDQKSREDLERSADGILILLKREHAYRPHS